MDLVAQLQVGCDWSTKFWIGPMRSLYTPGSGSLASHWPNTPGSDPWLLIGQHPWIGSLASHWPNTPGPMRSLSTPGSDPWLLIGPAQNLVWANEIAVHPWIWIPGFSLAEPKIWWTNHSQLEVGPKDPFFTHFPNSIPTTTLCCHCTPSPLPPQGPTQSTPCHCRTTS